MTIGNINKYPEWHFENNKKCIAWCESKGRKYEIILPEENYDSKDPEEFRIVVDGEIILGTGTCSLGKALCWCEVAATIGPFSDNIFRDELTHIHLSSNMLLSILDELETQNK